jgi:hypothetical protein
MLVNPKSYNIFVYLAYAVHKARFVTLCLFYVESFINLSLLHSLFRWWFSEWSICGKVFYVIFLYSGLQHLIFQLLFIKDEVRTKIVCCEQSLEDLRSTFFFFFY